MTNPSTNIASGKSTPVILQVLPRLETGGVERGTIDVALAIKAAGWTPLVASEGGRLVRELERAGIEHITLPLATKKPWEISRNAKVLEALIAERGISLVHARSRAPAWSAMRAARAAGVPFVTTFHGTYSLGMMGLKRRYNAVMTKGDRVIAISEFIRRHIQNNYDVDQGIVRTIPRGVDLSLFDPARVSAERIIQVAQRWRLPDDLPVILLPGRLTRWKGQLLLIEALSMVKDIPFRCVLVGSDQGRTAYREELEAAIDRFGLRASVQVEDDCKDMPAAYMASDIVVSASTEPEAFGRVPAEGMAMSRLVIVPDHGGATEIVRHGVTGWHFANRHPGSLAEMLRGALKATAAERAVLGQRGRAVVEERFSRDAMCAATLDVYRELLPRSLYAA